MLDVNIAFNSALWKLIIDRLFSLQILQVLIELIYSYFYARRVVIDINKLFTTQGIPEGSILGPMVCNVLFNSILNITILGNGFTLAYADDLALTVTAKDKQNLIKNGNKSLEEIIFCNEAN